MKTVPEQNTRSTRTDKHDNQTCKPNIIQHNKMKKLDASNKTNMKTAQKQKPKTRKVICM